MEFIDFHTHYVSKQLLNATWLNFLQSINPEVYAKIDSFSRHVEFFTTYLKAEGVKYAVVLPECAPATSGNVPTEEVIEYCRGQDRLIPFASLNPNIHPDLVSKLEFYVKDCVANATTSITQN